MSNTQEITDRDELLKENLLLKQQLEELQNEHTTVVRTIVKVLDSVGLWPIKEGDNLGGKAMKSVKSIMFDVAVNPKKLEERFSFLQDIYPLCEKYKDIQL